MVRVIEGELLDKQAGASAYDVARRWLLNSGSRQDAPGGDDLYARRAHTAIGTYLDTAFISGSRGDARVGLDLYV